MEVVLLAVLILMLLALLFCLLFRAPLIRAAEDRHGLAAVRDSIAEARRLRAAEQNRSSEGEGKLKTLRKQHSDITAALQQARQRAALLPPEAFDIVVELGSPDSGLEGFDFIVGRRRALQHQNDLFGPEAELWARPRRLRAWGRNRAAALASAQSRYTMADGFLVKTADRLDAPADPVRARA